MAHTTFPGALPTLRVKFVFFSNHKHWSPWVGDLCHPWLRNYVKRAAVNISYPFSQCLTSPRKVTTIRSGSRYFCFSWQDQQTKGTLSSDPAGDDLWKPWGGENEGRERGTSCLENPRDGGTWWAAIYGVAQSRTRLKWLSSSRERNRHNRQNGCFLILAVKESPEDVWWARIKAGQSLEGSLTLWQLPVRRGRQMDMVFKHRHGRMVSSLLSLLNKNTLLSPWATVSSSRKTPTHPEHWENRKPSLDICRNNWAAPPSYYPYFTGNGNRSSECN